MISGKCFLTYCHTFACSTKFSSLKARGTLLYKIMWGLMVAVFFFASTPHDFIHDEIAAHKDTVDGYHKHAGVSKAHVHCEFLQVSLSPSLPGQQLVLHFHVPVQGSSLPFEPSAAPSPVVPHAFLRGPPAFC